MQPRLNFVLLESEAKATSFLIKVLQKKGENVWKQDVTEEERVKAFDIVSRLVRKKYPDVTENKLREVWTNLQHAYLCPDIVCRYRSKLDFLVNSYPLAPLPSCSVVIPPEEQFDVEALNRLNGYATCPDPPMSEGTPTVEMKEVGIQTDSQRSVIARVDAELDALPPRERRSKEAALFAGLVCTRIEGTNWDPQERRRMEKRILKTVREMLAEYYRNKNQTV
uniref:MADF domain-containing protein n=1 Tax=Steinernema glaseri TaxID=37863 RepID=A0A1I8A3G3_9BILA